MQTERDLLPASTCRAFARLDAGDVALNNLFTVPFAIAHMVVDVYEFGVETVATVRALFYCHCCVPFYCLSAAILYHTYAGIAQRV